MHEEKGPTQSYSQTTTGNKSRWARPRAESERTRWSRGAPWGRGQGPEKDRHEIGASRAATVTFTDGTFHQWGPSERLVGGRAEEGTWARARGAILRQGHVSKDHLLFLQQKQDLLVLLLQLLCRTKDSEGY